MDDAGLVWRKSTFSETTSCVEVAFEGGAVHVRDGKNPTGGVLGFSAAEWDAFLAGARDGQFDPPSGFSTE